MYYEVFVDVVFLENMVSDYVAIRLTQQLLYRKKKYVRCILGASVGACVAIVRLCCPGGLQLYMGILYVIGCGIAMLIAFRKVKQLVLQTCCVHGFLMLMGAGLFVIKRILAWHHMQIAFAGYCVYVLMFEIAAMTVINICRKWQDEKNKKLYPVWIYFDQEPIYTTALLDTGNQLKDPASGRPVSILESSVCVDKGKIAIPAQSYCLIPFHSIGRESGVLHGVHVPLIRIQLDERTIECEDAVIALYHGRLSQDMSFRMILQPEVLQN